MNKRIPILLGLFLLALALWILIAPSPFARQLIEGLDDLGYDIQLRTFVLTNFKKPTTPIAIIDIDDKSLKEEGRWPWPRDKLADLMDRLDAYGATVVAFDIFFGEKESNIGQEVLNYLTKKKQLTPALQSLLEKNLAPLDYDSIFAKSLTLVPTVLAFGFLPRPQVENLLPPPLLTLSLSEQRQLALIRARGYISNIPILQNAAKNGGFINIFPDTDGIIRHAPLIMEYESKVYPSLALEAVLLFLNEKVQLVTPKYNNIKELEGLQIGPKEIPTDANGQVFIPFIGKSYSFPYYSATDVLHGNVPKNALVGKILFVGTSATGLGDLKATSIENTFPGVEIQATLANGLLLNHFSYKPAWTFGANFVLTLVLGLIASFLFPYLGPRILSLLIIILPIGLLFLNNWIWIHTGLILSFLMAVILILTIAALNMIYGYLFETRRREQLKEIFGQYVPAKHIDQMLKSKDTYSLGGEDRDMTVLFADIRNFTSISEGLSATELVEILNTFFTPMTEIIFKHRGTIDKYVGDLIMAFWGAPLKDRHHARHSIESALEMQKKIKSMHKEFAKRNWPEMKIGIGINSGIMSVGDMGSHFRRNYTVLGDAVNLASRIESLTKFYGIDIITTEFTQADQTRFIFRLLDRVRVKGKQSTITLYEVICSKEEATPDILHELELYSKALNDYFLQKWDQALDILEQLQKAHPHKKIYKIFLQRIGEFKINPPPLDWNGVYEHLQK